MFGEDDSRRLPAHLRREPPLHRLHRHKPNGPPRLAVGRWPAHHRDHGSRLRAVEERRRSRPRILPERRLQPAGSVAVTDTPGLARVSANGLRGSARRKPFGQEQQRSHSSPAPRRHLRAARAQRFELHSVFGLQLQRNRSHLVL